MISPFGEVNWVRNLRAAGCALMMIGRMNDAVIAVEPGLPHAHRALRDVPQHYDRIDHVKCVVCEQPQIIVYVYGKFAVRIRLVKRACAFIHAVSNVHPMSLSKVARQCTSKAANAYEQ